MKEGIFAFLCCVVILTIPTALFFFSMVDMFNLTYSQAGCLSGFFLLFLYLILDIWFDVRDINKKL